MEGVRPTEGVRPSAGATRSRRKYDGVAWVEEEFEHLWNVGKPLPEAEISKRLMAQMARVLEGEREAAA